jgi:hypothetical protein
MVLEKQTLRGDRFQIGGGEPGVTVRRKVVGPGGVEKNENDRRPPPDVLGPAAA